MSREPGGIGLVGVSTLLLLGLKLTLLPGLPWLVVLLPFLLTAVLSVVAVLYFILHAMVNG